MSKRFSSYNRSRSHIYSGGGGRNTFRNFGSFRKSGGRNSEPLDINLFIKKAKEENLEEAYICQNKFEDFGLAPHLLQNIKNKGYLSPTPIQDQSIATIMSGKDLIGIANTGTGKTAAFLIPMIDKILKDKTQRVFIIAPTRELALQINEELTSFTKGLNIYSALIMGGSGYSHQISDIRRNPHFVIGTPGRIKDLIEKRVLNLSTS